MPCAQSLKGLLCELPGKVFWGGGASVGSLPQSWEQRLRKPWGEPGPSQEEKQTWSTISPSVRSPVISIRSRWWIPDDRRQSTCFGCPEWGSRDGQRNSSEYLRFWKVQRALTFIFKQLQSHILRKLKFSQKSPQSPSESVGQSL